ncbi:MAG TPA: LysM peptidoglycan-binding domain-containing protein [Intrasporangium sp.]|nr:LysM peptidoglycan-binding domain-containing protein [Intrasporangium sp.]
MALAVLLALGFSATSAFAAAPTQTHTVTVEAGQTLSEIAASQLPALSLGDAIVEIQVANGLSTDQVHAGQTLAIPAG